MAGLSGPDRRRADERGHPRASRDYDETEEPQDEISSQGDVIRNRVIARRMFRYSELLSVQGDDPARVKRYRRAAEAVAGLDISLDRLFEGAGEAVRRRLPDIPPATLAEIEEILVTGHCSQFERLDGSLVPGRVFRGVNGVGATLARRLARTEEIESLEALSRVLRESNRRIRGIGPRRREVILEALDRRLKGQVWRRPSRPVPPPDLTMLLAADAEYRLLAAAGKLTRIAPRDMPEDGSPWLPVMHRKNGPWHMTLMRAPESPRRRAGRGRDPVSIFLEYDGEIGRQLRVETVALSDRGERRVVLGLEPEAAAPGQGQGGGARP